MFMTYAELFNQYVTNADYMTSGENGSRQKAGLFIAAGYGLLAYPKRFDMGGVVGMKKEIDTEQIRLAVDTAVQWLNFGGGASEEDTYGQIRVASYSVEEPY